MQVDVSFEFAKVYNVDKKIDVVKGQNFKLNTDLVGESKWFTDQDQVLELLQKGNNAEIQAADLGTSTILILGTDFGILKELTIQVIDEIVEPAVAINASSGQAIPK